MRHVVEVVGTVVIHDVAIDHVILALGCLEEQLGLALHLSEVIVHVYVVDHVAAVAEAGGEVQEQLALFFIVAGLGRPHAAHFAPFAAKLLEVEVCACPMLQVG